MKDEENSTDDTSVLVLDVTLAKVPGGSEDSGKILCASLSMIVDLHFQFWEELAIRPWAAL